jgi:hypothetical protein
MRLLVISTTIAGLTSAVTAVVLLQQTLTADATIAYDIVNSSSVSREEPMRLTTAETLIGTWTGRWQTIDGVSAGSLGLVLTRVPGHDTIVGQFTFIAGAISRTLRYEGRLDNGAVRFALVGDGYIVLEAGGHGNRPLTAERLMGTWVDERGALPAPRGTIELQRAS